ncbi:MAG: hypothetical protein GY708_18355 [Actinomycetia bacterium]|nr:hypothetical protein [Actinomycetes bacterium]MCP4963250.1 hypothetical protein [Actinomycetes bacterium]
MARGSAAVLIAIFLVSSACGGGSEVPETTESGIATTDPTTEGTSSAAPERVVSTEVPSDPFASFAIAQPPATATPPAPADDADSHIAAMFAAVADLFLDDPRATEGLWTELLHHRSDRHAPELVIRSWASGTSLAAEAYSLIGAYADVGAQAGYDPDFDNYWPVRSSAAKVFEDINRHAYDIIADADALAYGGRLCVATMLLGDGDGDDCGDGLPEAQAILDEFAELLDSSELPDEPDDFDDGVPLRHSLEDLTKGFELCRLWTPIVAELGPERTELFDALIDDSFIDTKFLGRSDCRWDAGLDEDASWDFGPGRDAFANVYTSLVAAGAGAPFDEDMYDSYNEVTPEEYNEAVKTTVLLLAQAALEAASVELGRVVEPQAGIGLASIVHLSTGELWIQELMGGLESDDDPYLAIAEALGCEVGTESGPPDCTDEQSATLESIRRFEFRRGAMSLGEVVDWEDVERDLGLCQLWNDALGAAGAETATRVDFQVNQLGLDEVYGIDDCDADFDDGSSTASP